MKKDTMMFVPFGDMENSTKKAMLSLARGVPELSLMERYTLAVETEIWAGFFSVWWIVVPTQKFYKRGGRIWGRIKSARYYLYCDLKL